MAKIIFGDEEEQVVTKAEFPLDKARSVLQNDLIAVLGYGVQGPAQALNLKDNGFNVIVGQRSPSPSWEKAIEDGWQPNENLFELAEASERASIILYLLSDAGQIQYWPELKQCLNAKKTLIFAHSFVLAFNDQTGVVPPEEIDVGLLAPKGAAITLRRLFLDGKELNSSYAVYQDASGLAEERIKALGIAIGSGYLFETTCEKEAHCDLVGERGILVGAIAGAFEAQYEVLRSRGHSPSEAFNETVEEFTESLLPLVGENGMEWLYANCSTTAQRGALDWKPRFKAVLQPVFAELYDSVASGVEAMNVIEANSSANYRDQIDAEIREMSQLEIWRVGRQVRSLRSG